MEVQKVFLCLNNVTTADCYGCPYSFLNNNELDIDNCDVSDNKPFLITYIQDYLILNYSEKFRSKLDMTIDKEENEILFEGKVTELPDSIKIKVNLPSEFQTNLPEEYILITIKYLNDDEQH